MEILEKIYEMYIANSLDLKPEKVILGVHEEIDKLEEEYCLSPELADEIEEAMLDIVAENQKKSFFAGFKLAFKFIKELSNDPKKDTDE